MVDEKANNRARGSATSTPIGLLNRDIRDIVVPP
jgi:hypothetical protein